MRERQLRVLALAALGIAAAWVLLELVASASLAAYAVLGAVLAVGVIAALFALEPGRGSWERSSTVFLGVAFFGNRIVFLGVDVLTVSAFLALLVFVAVLQRFHRLFGDVYQNFQGDAALLREVDRALARGLGRALGALGIALALTLVVASVASLGLAPFTTSLSALVLILLLILAVARLVRNPSAARDGPK